MLDSSSCLLSIRLASRMLRTRCRRPDRRGPAPPRHCLSSRRLTPPCCRHRRSLYPLPSCSASTPPASAHVLVVMVAISPRRACCACCGSEAYLLVRAGAVGGTNPFPLPLLAREAKHPFRHAFRSLFFSFVPPFSTHPTLECPNVNSESQR